MTVEYRGRAAFFDDSESGPQALALAYEDVIAAFRYYVTHFNEGRPFVLAAHSQGSRHADYLMADEIVGTELANRMIAAYPVGFEIDGSNGVPVCDTPTQTGCQVTWNSVGPAAGALFASPDNICVNPLTWRGDGAHADHERAREPRAARDGDRVEVGERHARLGEGRPDGGLDRLEMRACGDLGHDAAVAGVLLHRGGDDVGEQGRAAHDADAGLVAARLDPEDEGLARNARGLPAHEHTPWVAPAPAPAPGGDGD